MLRASVETHGQDVQLEAIMTGDATAGIAHSTELAAFAESIVTGGVGEIKSAREALVNIAGWDVMVDAAGVASNFQRMVRIADSTGITLGSMDKPSEDLREALGINEFRVST